MNHCERLLALLADGKPHSHHEIYALRIMGHSRAADLRARGYDIRVEQTRNEYGERDYTYQLVGRPLPPPGQEIAPVSSHLGGDARRTWEPGEPCPGDENGQLALEVAG